jgi:ferritin-like metal-binding protein YciE
VQDAAAAGRAVTVWAQGRKTRWWHATGYQREVNRNNLNVIDVMKNGLHALFLEELADVYNAEQQLTKALPQLAKAAQNDQLRHAFESHLEETETHVSRLEQIFESLEESPKKRKCKGMEGIIKEGKDVMSEHKQSSETDAALISAAQKTEHYEIATYGCLCTWAEEMGHDKALDLLKETLNEEKAADEKLTGIARASSNSSAEESSE